MLKVRMVRATPIFAILWRMVEIAAGIPAATIFGEDMRSLFLSKGVVGLHPLPSDMTIFNGSDLSILRP